MFNFSNISFPSPINGFPHSPTLFLSQEKDGGSNVHFNHHHHHHPFVTGDSSSFHHQPPNIQNSDNNYCNVSESVNSPSKKRVVVVASSSSSSKKDRHSKIFTAQGPRDRRVRLSIEISRKFFGLQDLLGFDKASKTLDWLFTKSKTAIKDLLEEKKQTSSSSTLTHQCEQVFMEKLGDHVHHVEKNKGKKKSDVINNKYVINNNNGGKRKKKTSQKNPMKSSGFHHNHVNLAARNQLRAEARARARERTIEKSRSKNHESKNHVVVLGENSNNNNYYCYDHQSNHEEARIGESFMEQKLPMPYSLLYTSHFKNNLH